MSFILDSFYERSLLSFSSEQKLTARFSHILRQMWWLLLNTLSWHAHVILTPVVICHYLSVLVSQFLNLISIC